MLFFLFGKQELESLWLGWLWWPLNRQDLSSETKHNRAGKRLCHTQRQADSQVLDQASPSLGYLINETIDPRELEFP